MTFRHTSTFWLVFVCHIVFATKWISWLNDNNVAAMHSINFKGTEPVSSKAISSKLNKQGIGCHPSQSDWIVELSNIVVSKNQLYSWIFVKGIIQTISKLKPLKLSKYEASFAISPLGNSDGLIKVNCLGNKKDEKLSNPIKGVTFQRVYNPKIKIRKQGKVLAVKYCNGICTFSVIVDKCNSELDLRPYVGEFVNQDPEPYNEKQLSLTQILAEWQAEESTSESDDDSVSEFYLHPLRLDTLPRNPVLHDREDLLLDQILAEFPTEDTEAPSKKESN